MTKSLTLQPSSHVDHITTDGTELTKRPYPFHVDPQGFVARQEFWRADPYLVIGFANAPGRAAVDLWFDNVWVDPQRAVGMYPVTEDGSGQISTHIIAIDTVTENP